MSMSFAKLDIFPKTLQEFRHRTQTGAIVSIVCATLIATLTMIELADFVQVKTHDHLTVDTSRGQKLRININITFPALPCAVLSLDALDLSGNDAAGHMPSIKKVRLDAQGKPLDGATESLHPSLRRHLLFEVKHDDSPDVNPQTTPGKPGGLAPAGLLSNQFQKPNLLLSSLLSELLPSVFEDKEAIEEIKKHMGEGCDFSGHIIVNKVAGDFHFALQKADHHALLSVYKSRESLNVSHIIHSISFGEPYPGMVNPLENSPKILSDGSGYFQYYIKVVPTVYEPLGGKEIVNTNQYSYTELFRTTKDIEKLPAVHFHYEISPIMARFSESRRSLSNFLTGLCAIVGGVFTVAGMVDSCVYRIHKATTS